LIHILANANKLFNRRTLLFVFLFSFGNSNEMGVRPLETNLAALRGNMVASQRKASAAALAHITAILSPSASERPASRTPDETTTFDNQTTSFVKHPPTRIRSSTVAWCGSKSSRSGRHKWKNASSFFSPQP